MRTSVRSKIVKMGNSQGLRIPKPLLEQSGISDAVEIEVHPSALIVRPVASPVRAGWADAFKKMAASGDDRLLDTEAVATSEWDAGEWEW